MNLWQLPLPAKPKNRTVYLLACMLVFMVSYSHASAYRVETLAEGLEFPWSLAFLPDGQLLVSERTGSLQLIDSQGEKRKVVGVPNVFAAGQAGLKHVALAPDFAQSQFIYLTYSCGTQRANSLCLARARLAGQALQDLSLLFTAQPMRRGAAHYGG
ncbi:MAG TPA: PQQ-dependent sugar dehydrogenase, partial [Cellvibrionaceae bacterium]